MAMEQHQVGQREEDIEAVRGLFLTLLHGLRNREKEDPSLVRLQFAIEEADQERINEIKNCLEAGTFSRRRRDARTFPWLTTKEALRCSACSYPILLAKDIAWERMESTTPGAHGPEMVIGHCGKERKQEIHAKRAAVVYGSKTYVFYSKPHKEYSFQVKNAHCPSCQLIVGVKLSAMQYAASAEDAEIDSRLVDTQVDCPSLIRRTALFRTPRVVPPCSSFLESHLAKTLEEPEGEPAGEEEERRQTIQVNHLVLCGRFLSAPHTRSAENRSKAITCSACKGNVVCSTRQLITGTQDVFHSGPGRADGRTFLVNSVRRDGCTVLSDQERTMVGNIAFQCRPVVCNGCGKAVGLKIVKEEGEEEEGKYAHYEGRVLLWASKVEITFFPYSCTQ